MEHSLIIIRTKFNFFFRVKNLSKELNGWKRVHTFENSRKSLAEHVISDMQTNGEVKIGNYVIHEKEKLQEKMEKVRLKAKREEFYEIKNDFKSNLGEIVKATANSMNSIDSIRSAAKTNESSCISKNLPSSKTMVKECKKSYDLNDEYSKFNNGLVRNEGSLQELFGVEIKLYL